LLLLLASVIWGLAFVAQRVGMRHVGPLTFNGVRFALGAAVLLPMVIWGTPGRTRMPRVVPVRKVLGGGLVAGVVLFVAATLQQYGVVFTTAGKAGFITSLYVVLVPILGLVIGQRTGRHIWAGAVLAAIGLYLLSAQGLVGIALGDGLVLIGAVFWAIHMLVIGRLAPGVRAMELAVTQFTVVSVLSLIAAVIFAGGGCADSLCGSSVRGGGVHAAGDRTNPGPSGPCGCYSEFGVCICGRWWLDHSVRRAERAGLNGVRPDVGGRYVGST